VKRAAIAALMLSTLGIAAVYLSAFLPGGAPPAAAPVMIISLATMMIAMMVLGAMRNGHLGRRLSLSLAGAWLILVVGFLAALYLPAESASHMRLFFGLPLRSAIVLYGVGLLPLVAMPIAYALTFDDATLSAQDLERLRGEASDILQQEKL
jgi:amino acid transporter